MTDAVEQVRAVAKTSEQALAAKVCWTMQTLLCIFRAFAVLTIDVQDEIVAAKDAELEQALATVTAAKVCFFRTILVAA